jgi:hypothetical protein
VDKGWLAVRTCAGIAGEGQQVVDHRDAWFRVRATTNYNLKQTGSAEERSMRDEQQGTISRTDAENCVKETISSFEDFDDDEPLTAGARDIFRHELVPEFKSLVARLLQYELYQEARDVCRLWSCFHGIIIENSHLGDGILLQLSDLPEEFRSWKPE